MDIWESEEMADAAIQGLVGLMEWSHLDHEADTPYKRTTIDDFGMMKLNGIYFSPGDRIIINGHIDEVNDLGPEYFSNAHLIDENSCHQRVKQFYMIVYSGRKIIRLPRGVFGPINDSDFYKVTTWAFLRSNFQGCPAMTSVNYYSINKLSGKIYPCFSRSEKSHAQASPQLIQLVADAYTLWQDKKHLWNVTAMELLMSKNETRIDDLYAKVTFGVYEEHIKSLLYARDMPLTSAGRKRPILHWVSAHKRRLERGVEIDISKHLRGVTSLSMGGINFEITNPVKGKIHVPA